MKKMKVVLAEFRFCVFLVLVFLYFFKSVSAQTPQTALFPDSTSLLLRLNFAQDKKAMQAFFPIEAYAYFEDETANLPANEILKQNFTTFKGKEPNEATLHVGNGKNCIWVKLDFYNETSENNWILELNGALADVELYEKAQNQLLLLYKTGLSQDFESRPIQTDAFLFPLQIPTLEAKTYYVHLKSDYFQGKMGIGQPLYFYERDHKIDIIEGILYGCFLIMLFYNFVIYLSSKEKLYLYYALMLTFSFLAIMQLRGHGFEWLWRNFPIVNQYAPIFHAGNGFFSILFVRYYLKMRENSLVFNRILLFFSASFLLAILAALLGFKTFASLTNQLSALFSAPFTLIAALVIWKKGFKLALYVVLAWGLYLIGMIIFVLAGLEILPYTTFTKNAAHVGALLEMILLALAVAAQIDFYKKEHAKAQRESMELLEENQNLISEQNKVLEAKVSERTEELNMLNEELIQNLDKLNSQNIIIERKNQNITASITYAKRIQEAMLPEKSFFEQHLKEHFIFFQPRDIVSGDFYYAKKIVQAGSEKIILAAVDCTGHGVPGAFMSLIGNDLLNEIIELRQITQPDEILNQLHASLHKSLKHQQHSQIADGMDIAICCFDKEANTLYFAGARNQLFYIEDGKGEFIKGNIFSVGEKNYERKGKIIFSKHTLSLKNASHFYLFSDGFADQFGGERNKKFTSKALRDLLFQIHELPMTSQYEILTETFHKWRGTQRQIDDVLVMGFKV
ncbi:7TM diverse intracellular signaling domain-containing protein [Hugenholtzia roseola]|uniref:7TM diverse intracellular signaling domain-containing protein n=1 Tax=Hugenholtzia roseola TaxID=1002 RepID=UPI001B7FACD7|nr:7TM diverse intracellular signaling domain-containing protein [Hugenholtzia roseola]